MKAAVFYGKADIRFEERPIPKPGLNQLVVKIDYCGVCGTDVESYETGNVIQPVIVFGHENIGTVAEVGEGVTEFNVGDRVLCGPPSFCKEGCPSCHEGKTNICIYGFPRTCGIGGPDGGYAEYMLVPDVAHTILVKVPKNVDPKQAVLFDVVCVSLHGIRISRFRMGDNVVVSGTGPIGIAAIQLLKAAGANKIIAIGTTSSKYPKLKEYGADYCVNPKETPDLGAEIKRILGRDVGADVVFECAGNNASLRNCVNSCVKPGGQVIIIGQTPEPMDIVPARFSIFEIDLQTSFVYTSEEVKMYLDLLSSGKINFDGIVTSVIPLRDCIEKGILHREGQLKVLIDPSL